LAKERKASVIYEGNASQLVYAFPFDYLRKKFVKVEDIYTNITELTIGVDYTVEDKQVRLVKGIPLGHSVKIYRETTTAPLVEWQDASVLRSADLSLQEVQLLHLAEETGDRVFDSGMSTAYDNPNCWDGQYKRIINALDPIEDGDVVTLRYIKSNQDSLLNQLKSTGATQNSSIIATGDTQNKRLTDTGNAYVSTMTTLKDTATTKANDASNSAELSKKWAMSSSSPDGVSGNKSAKTWAEEANTSASNSADSASASQSSATESASSATNAANSANASKQSASASANSATAAASSASQAASSATAAKASETNAASSASAAAQSEENAKTWDPTSYYSKSEIPVVMLDLFYPVGTVYISADKSKTKADFPFMAYGTWEEVPVNLCLQTGSASEAGTQRSAGLPNITGKANVRSGGNSGANILTSQSIGAIACTNQDSSFTWNYHIATENGQNKLDTLSFNASNSNPIYGKSSTVQPPAYMVRAWVRTA
jgi:hypothetical protein